MELVTIVQIELPRPQSAQGYGFSASNPRNGLFIVRDEEVATLKEAVVKFAEQCGVDRGQLQSLQQVSGYHFSSDPKVVVFNIETRNVQYSTPYALCKAHPALKIGDRYFELSELSNVISLSYSPH